MSMVPIQIYSANDQKIKKIVWQNPSPSSTRYCRPIKFIFAEETLNVIKTEVKMIKEQVISMLPTKISINDMEVSVKPMLIFCMIDGKVCSTVAGCETTRTCYLCGAKPREVNDERIIMQKTVNRDLLSLRLSPLHTWIRIFECTLHLSYCWMQALANDGSLCRFSIADWRCRFAHLYLALFLCETLFSSSVCVPVCVSACVVHLFHLIHVFNKEMFMNWTCIQFPRLHVVAGLEGKALSDWSTKNEDAVSYVKLSLSDEQALQYANEDNAKTLWEKINSNFTGQAEDRKIYAGNELRNLRLCEKEKIWDYIARARGLATKCASLGLDVTERELEFYVVRGLTGRYAKLREILKTQREKSIDDLLEILREEEILQNNVVMPTEVSNPDLAFTAVGRQRQKRVCYFCRKPNHVMKDCFIRKRIEAQKKPKFYNSSRKNKDLEALALSSEVEETSTKHVWILDSGASAHMVKERIWFENFVSSTGEVFLA
ncbi:hypothetical protein AVEN_77588-1 [Araneus ventricosus]|uniref:CCHC-type domain-containing protein n=1 Tax=Araneus ventricosus TaxID=182803 RepID=A0A4Y2LV85_ARAVE|nr:hypothetical protein AVEN_77588-1 [Araneus ventricosus]